MMRPGVLMASGLAAGGLAVTATYLGLVTGAAPLDLGVGRRTRSLPGLEVRIAASREVVFDVIATPYAERAPRALREKVQVLHRGSDLVLAAHVTPIRGRLRALTTETVRLLRPERVDFRLVRGPVPHVQESFLLDEVEGGTVLSYTGELGTDLWGLGERWGDLVAKSWVATVRESMADVKKEAERRTRVATRAD